MSRVDVRGGLYAASDNVARGSDNPSRAWFRAVSDLLSKILPVSISLSAHSKHLGQHLTIYAQSHLTAFLHRSRAIGYPLVDDFRPIMFSRPLPAEPLSTRRFDKRQY